MDDGLIIKRRLEYEKIKQINLAKNQKELDEQKELSYRIRLVESELPLHNVNKKTLGNFDFTKIEKGGQIEKIIKEFIEPSLFENPEKVNFLTLYGNNGRGKTHILQAIGFELIKFTDVYYYKISELLDLIQEKQMSNTYLSFMEQLKGTSCLLLDDFGDQKETDFRIEKLDMLIDYRYEYNKMTVVSTNKNLVGLISTNKRVASRLMSGICINLVGEDYRVKEAKRKGYFI